MSMDATRTHRLFSLSQSLYFSLACFLSFQVGLVFAQSTGIDPSSATTRVEKVNDVPVVKIAAPSAGGVSHNTFDKFNVGTPGVVINNSLVDGHAQLVGKADEHKIMANDNFTTGVAASIILNEVTDTRSYLNGTTEVFGANARYILANPNGITCNGCGFIRTHTGVSEAGVGDATAPLHEVTLSTGKVSGDPAAGPFSLVIDTNNERRLIINSDGLNASGVDKTTLMTRGLKVRGAVNGGGALNIVTGQGSLDTSTGTFSKTENNNTPWFDYAIDAKALGAMQAGRIFIQATEAGVGVSLDMDLLATQGDIELTTNGDLIQRKQLTAQQGAVSVSTTGAGHRLTLQKMVQAAGDITLASAGDLRLGDNLSAQGGINLSLGGDTRFDHASDQSLILSAGTDITLACAAGNTGCSIDSREHTTINAQTLTTHAAISTELDKDLFINAALEAHALIESGRDLSITAASGNITAQALSARNLALNINDSAGILQLNGNLTVDGDISLQGAGSYTHAADRNDSITGEWAIDLGTLINNGQLGLLKDHQLSATNLTNNGLIHSDAALQIKVDESLINNGDLMSLEGTLQLSNRAGGNIQTLNNTGLIGSLSLTQHQNPASEFVIDPQAWLQNHQAQILAGKRRGAGTLMDELRAANQLVLDRLTAETGLVGGVLIRAQQLANSGEISGNNLSLHTGSLSNTGGLILASANISIDGGSLNNSNAAQQGVISSRYNLDISLSGNLVNQGLLESGDIGINAADVNNNPGSVTAIAAGSMLNSDITGLASQARYQLSTPINNPGSSSYYRYRLAGDADAGVDTNTSALSQDFLTDNNLQLPTDTLWVGDDIIMARLIQDSLRAQGGLPYLSDERHAITQLHGLYQQTQAFMTQTGLQLGQTPNAAQLSQATQPVLVFNTQIINGQAVLTPSVYLPTASQHNGQQMDQLFSQIHARNNLSIKADTLTNESEISAGDLIDIEAGNFLQTQNGERAWTVDADGNVLYRKPTLRAGKGLLMKLAGDYQQYAGSVEAEQLNIQAKNIYLGDGNRDARRDPSRDPDRDPGSYTTPNSLSALAEARAITDAAPSLRGGNLQLTATDDIVNTVGTIKGSNSVYLNAGGDIKNNSLFYVSDVNTQNTHSGRSRRGTHTTSRWQDVVMQTASISAGEGGLTQIAGGDIINRGGQLSSSGDIYQQAKGDIKNQTLAQVYLKRDHRETRYSHYTTGSGGRDGDRQTHTRTDTTHDYVTALAQQAASITAGGNVVQQSDGRIDNIGANLTAKGNVYQNAKGGINNQSLVFDLNDASSAFRAAKPVRNDAPSQQLLTASISAGGSLTMIAGDVQGCTNVAGAGCAGATKSERLADIKNDGNLTAGGAIYLSANNIHNTRLNTEQQVLDTGNISAGESLTLQAHNDILDTAGRYSAKNDLYLIAGGEIKQDVITLTEQDDSYNYRTYRSGGGGRNNDRSSSYSRLVGESHKTIVTNTAGSFNAGGNIMLQAKGDLTLVGTDITAGKAIQLSGDNVSLEAAENSVHAWSKHGRTKRRSHNIDHDIVALAAGSSITVTATGELNEQGELLRAGKLTTYGTSFRAGVMADPDNADATIAADASGHVILNASGDMSLLGVNNETYSFYKKTKKRSFGRRKTKIREDHSITHQGTSIDAGGSVLVNIKQDDDGKAQIADSGAVLLSGAQINAAGNTMIAGQGGVEVLAAKDYSFRRRETRKRGAFGYKTKSKGSINQRLALASTRLTAAADLSVLSGSDLTIQGSNLIAGRDVDLDAVGKLLISADQEINSEKTWSVETRMLSGGSLYQADTEIDRLTQGIAKGSVIQAGNNINVTGDTGKVIGSVLKAGNDLHTTITKGDLETLSALNTEERFHYEKTIRVSFGDAIEGLSEIDEILKTKNGRLTVKLAEATYDELENTTKTTSQSGSLLSAGNNLILDGGKDIIVGASTLIADADGSGEGTLALRAKGNVHLLDEKDLYTSETDETHGRATLNFVVQNEFVEAGNALTAVKEAKQQLKTARKDYSHYKKDLSRLKGDLNALETAYANKEPGVDYQDLIELRELVSDVEDDEDWYKVGIATATANVVSKTTGAAQSMAAAAQSTGTYGFNAGWQLDIDATKTETNQQQTSSVGSRLQGHDILIKTGNGLETAAGTETKIRGSQLLAANSLTIDTGTLNLLAGKNTGSSDTDTKQISVSVQQTAYGSTAGGPSADLSLNRNKSDNESSTWSNSQLLADNINLTTTDDANLFGANVHANKTLVANIGGDLHLESKQNRYKSNNKGLGISVSASFEGAASEEGQPKTELEREKARIAKKNHDESFSGAMDNLGNFGDGSVSGGGFNISNGRSRSRETVLTSLTSGGTADIAVGGHTQITGALIASRGEDGSYLGNLNLSTTTLSFHDLSDTRYNSQRASGINVSDNSSQWNYSNASGYGKSKTLATLGKGSLTVRDTENSDDLLRLNRDVQNASRDLYSVDRQQGNIDMKVDHRLLSADGRTQIAEDFKRSAMMVASISDVVTEESVRMGDLFKHMGDEQKELDVQNAIARIEAGLNAQTLNNLDEASFEDKQAAVDAYAEIYAATFDISIEAARVVAVNAQIGGAHVYENGTSRIYVNDHAQDNALGYANNLGHEVTHAQIAQDADMDRGDHDLNEAYAKLRGERAADLYAFSYSNNGLGAVNLGRTNAYKGNGSSSQLRSNTQHYLKENTNRLDHSCLMGSCSQLAQEGSIQAHYLLGDMQRVDELTEAYILASLMQAGSIEQVQKALEKAHPQVIDDAVAMYQEREQEDTATNIAGAGILAVGALVVAGPSLLAGATTLVMETGAFISNPYTFCSINPHLCLAGAETVAEIGTGSVLAASVVPNASKQLVAKYGDEAVDVLRGTGDEMLDIVTASRAAKADAVGDVVKQTKQERSVLYGDVPEDRLLTSSTDLSLQSKHYPELKVSEAQTRLPSGVNQELLKRGYRAPYAKNAVVVEAKLAKDTQFVRVFTIGKSESVGKWLMSAKDIRGLTPKQIQRKYALPSLPTHITNVNVPRGTKIRAGKVGPNFGYNGGNTQYELLGRIENAFSNAKPLQ